MPPAVRVSGPYRDYKIGSRRGGGVARMAAIAGVIVAVAAAAWFLIGRELRSLAALRAATALVREGNLKAAESRFQSLVGSRFFGQAARDGLGLVALLRGDAELAAKHFGAAGTGEVSFSPLGDEVILTGLLEAGDYERAELLASRSRARKDSASLRMYHGVALNGLDRLAPAREAMAGGPLRSVFERVKRGDNLMLGGVFKDEKILKLYAGHVKSLVEKERGGRRAWLFDRQGKSLFRVSIKTGQADGPGAAMHSAVFGPSEDGKSVGDGGLQRFVTATDRRNRVEVTLDPELQRLAWSSLKNYRGAMVILGPGGEILAAAARDNLRYRKLRGGVPDERPTPDPFSTLIHVGSLGKVPTLTAALSLPGTVEAVFPFLCKGSDKIGGRVFYDSRRHGQVNDYEQALAHSCNLGFAALAQRLGHQRLLETFASFGFGTLPGAGRVIGDPLAPGPLASVDDIPDDERAVADLGVGLGPSRMTVVGAAAIALAIGSQGEYREPWVIKKKETIGGHVYAEARPVVRRIASAEVASRVAVAMRRVVTDEEGTARRAQHELLTLAAKTGTTGGDREGFEAILAGFVPATAPRLAFAIYLNGTGRAEWDAAMATRMFLDGLHALEEDRDREKQSVW